MKYKAARSCVSAMQPRPARASTMMGASNMEEPVNQDIINLYDRFTPGGMSRRTFLDRLAELAGSTAAAAALLPLLQNDYARAAIVPPDDGRLASERVTYDSPKGKINGYLVRGKAKGGPPSSSSMRTAGSTRTSRTSRAGWRSRAISCWRPTFYR
jgi:hypothetical protein